MAPVIYLLHFERPVSGHASHYMGSVSGKQDSRRGLRARLADHRAGHGSKLTSAAVAQDIKFWLVRIWPGGRAEERRLKQKPRGSRGHSERCPLCKLGADFAQQLPAVPL